MVGINYSFISSTNANAFIILYFFITIITIPFSQSIYFNLSTFDPEGCASTIVLRGDASISGGKIELNKVDYSYWRVGHVTYNGGVPLWDPQTGKSADFATHFTFAIDVMNHSLYSDGIAFFIAPVGFEIPTNSAGGFLGLFNSSNYDSGANQIVLVEFDSYQNKGWDPPYEHVGINRNSIGSSKYVRWNVSSHSGELIDAWIVYNSTIRNLSVFWNYGGRKNSSLSYQIDLRQVLPQWVTIGFSAATGNDPERHVLSSWEFSSTLDEKLSEKKPEKNVEALLSVVGFSVLGCLLITCVLITFIVPRKRRQGHVDDESNKEMEIHKSLNDDLDLKSGPRSFSYQEVACATNNFSNVRKLGQGGFGGVYKGYLMDKDLPIAVKRFSKGSKQGKAEYVTEVKVISRLRHKNLVKLIGWCHEQGEYLLVYEYMPNKSLDHHLFGEKANRLNWNSRYNIALGLSSALLYLHEESDQCVVHRDIKSSNVMLDSSFNAKLGDFGLARLVDHEISHETTAVAGTLGYTCPEYMSTGRASKKSDVYSFGVVVLEIATGKKSVDPRVDGSSKGLVEQVMDLYIDDRLILGVEYKLGEDFETKEFDCLIRVGLWCTGPDPALRPSIRQVCRVLNFEVEPPNISKKLSITQ